MIKKAKESNEINFKIVSFDMDGTLTYKIPSLQYFATKLNKESKAKELENFYQSFKLTEEQVATVYAKFLKGLTREKLFKWAKEMPQLKNIGQTVKSLKNLGLQVGITSVGPYFVAEYFQKNCGFDFVSGSTHEFKKEVHQGKMIRVLSGQDKVKILELICQQKRVKLSQVIAVGDSRSDIPIFSKAGLDISLNGDDSLVDKADIFIQTDDLLDVYRAIKARLKK